MFFTKEESDALLALKGVGPTVLKRLEEIGIHSLKQLKQYEVDEITHAVSVMLHSACWKNSPLAQKAIRTAIDFARLQSE